uniref:Forkhead box N1 n=1 Tax=Cynoglossus semilaevis TaxID=244447 RepID=A0A3P8V9P7_CYNSE
MSDSSLCSSSHTCTLQANLSTCEPCGPSFQQMAESPDTFSPRAAALNRRASSSETINPGSGSAPGRGLVDPDCFTPYRRQFRDGAECCLQQCPPSFGSLQDAYSPDASSLRCSSDAPPPTSTICWDQYTGSVQSSCLETPTVAVEPNSFLSQSYPSYNSPSSLQQVSSRPYSNNDQARSTKYSLQTISTQSHPETNTEPSFPKPIYSYSILIFMALQSSKTGSLPVSEIYSFMTEHFPYFKTAPDGWKNSVRHNLSLNKCFEKVENKNGNSSRKGCLWALNPAKVGKMQEELHKWRRKDPITVRRSMARPEDLDHLVGPRHDKVRSLPPYTNPSLVSRMTLCHSTTPSPCGPALLRPHQQPIPCSGYLQLLPQPPCHIPPATAHPNATFALRPPCGLPPTAGVPSTAGHLNSPTAGKMPPGYDSVLQTECGIRNMQDLLLEGDVTYDLDGFTPSLTDLQLQGNIWEEMREDVLVSDPQVSTTTLCGSSVLPDPRSHNSSNLVVRQTSEETTVSACKTEKEDEDAVCGQNLAEDGCVNGLHPVAYSGVENIAGYLTSCTTFISLM